MDSVDFSESSAKALARRAFAAKRAAYISHRRQMAREALVANMTSKDYTCIQQRRMQSMRLTPPRRNTSRAAPS